jgi:hypothetical protein
MKINTSINLLEEKTIKKIVKLKIKKTTKQETRGKGRVREGKESGNGE